MFNEKAKNIYRNRTVLAYCVNIFLNVGEKQYYLQHGINVHEDEYALSVMVQWIWRSAIRDGGEIWAYVPSRRMRTLLERWIQDVSALASFSGQTVAPMPQLPESDRSASISA